MNALVSAEPAGLTQEQIQERVRELGEWFHNLDLRGVQTAPRHFLGDYPQNKWQTFAHALPADLRGKTVLDIGCNAGFYALEMQRRGADRVVAIDFDETYLAQARFAAQVRGADIEFHQLSVYDVARLGERFDVVLFLGVFYHLRHPLLALDRSESCGRAVQVNRPIQDGVPGKERVVAAHFGFRAKPLPGFINEVMVQSGMTNANVTWTTLEESTSRVEYGLTANYGSSSPLDSSLTTNHAVQLTGLKPGTNYYIRVLSQTAPNQQYWADSCFVTTNNVIMGTVFDLVHEWSYSTQNLDGIHWQAIHYDD